MNIDDIRARAQGVRRGGVSSKEVEYARNILRVGVGNISSAIYIVGYCGNDSDSNIIERYLLTDQADMYGELSLIALCRYLGLIDKYRSYVRNILLSPDEELWINARMAAIHLSFEYLKNHPDNEFGCKLISIMLDENDPDRASSRNELVRILDLKGKVKFPFQMEFDNTDDDTLLITETAKKRYWTAPRE